MYNRIQSYKKENRRKSWKNIRTVLWEDVFLRDSVKISSKADTKQQDELREATIGKELGVSRTPVREALRQLELEGLVTIVPNKRCLCYRNQPEGYLGYLSDASVSGRNVRQMGGGTYYRRPVRRIRRDYFTFRISDEERKWITIKNK